MTGNPQLAKAHSKSSTQNKPLRPMSSEKFKANKTTNLG
jgi:hypothetical protein